MVDVLDVLEVVVDLGLEGVVAWVLRLLGLVALLAGIGLWLLTDMGLLVVPALLIVAGLVLLVAPGVLLGILELVG